jgi:DNA-binding LytR/AlgR family response regulator
VREDMKVSIEEIRKDQEEEILIRCYEVNTEIYEIVNKLKMENLILLGYQNESIHRIKLSDIYYFEAVDGKVFFSARTKFLK